MNLQKRVESFEHLGNLLRSFHEAPNDPEKVLLAEAVRLAYAENQWFTPENIRIALNSLGEALQPENLSEWLFPYLHRLHNTLIHKTVGVVMAGNIPAVGFHDFLCVLISGHKLKARLSSSDHRLIPVMADILIRYLPEWQEMITFTRDRLEQFDVIIATGSDNTSRYFEYYFGKYPHIIRKNRNSVAIIRGDETEDDLRKLAGDIMLYFGMGCRSVSKIWVPRQYDFTALISALKRYDAYANHNKYRNNYDYSKSIFMVNQIPVIDTGCMLLKEDPAINSRISVLNYEYYNRVEDVLSILENISDSIQCIISAHKVSCHTILPGMAQNPALWDYADDIDTLDFLLS